MRRSSLAGLLAVVTALLISCGPSGGAPTASLASPSIVPGTKPPTALSWQRSGPAPGPTNAAMYDVVASRDGLVAIGGEPLTGSVVWRSTDGLSWNLVQPADIDDGGGMISLVALPDRLVAVGRILHTERETAAAWISSDGSKWRLAEATAAFDGGQIIRATPGGPGLVAVGSAPGQDAGAAWLSADGSAWERVEHVPDFDHAFLWTVARTGTGFLAGGWRRSADGAGFEAAIWSSPDGRSWSLEPALPGGTGFQVRGLAVAPNGRIVAVGDLVEGGRASAWTSADRTEWTQVDDASFDGASLVAVVAGGPGLVAGGTRNRDDAGVWTSADGSSWAPIALDVLFDGAYITSIAATAGRLVAVGALQRPIPGSQSYETTPVSWVSDTR